MVVGAGLAGAAVCERLCARGWEVDAHEKHAEPAMEASGNHAGAFHPVATPDDSVFARLTRAGFLLLLVEKTSKACAGMRAERCSFRGTRRKKPRSATAALGQPAEYLQYVDREEAVAPRRRSARRRRAVVPAGRLDPAALAGQGAARGLR